MNHPSAGRCMSRKKAHDMFRIQTVRKELEARGVHVLAAGSDEVPGVYKDIRQVMRYQLVKEFKPKWLSYGFHSPTILIYRPNAPERSPRLGP